MPSKPARDAILDSAEMLFGERGFNGASLRQITEKAGVNLAAVNYYFRSKEDLYRQVVIRRVRPINEQRLILLTQAEQLAGDQAVPLRAILDTFIRPFLRTAGDPASGGSPFVRLLGRELTDPLPFLRGELEREFAPLMTRYTHALSQALPGVSPAELDWRRRFAFGAMLFLAARAPEPQRATTGAGPAEERDGGIRRLVDFCAAGFAAARPSA